MTNNKAILFSAVKPNKKQEQGFKTFLNNKYNEDIVLEWIEDKSLNNIGVIAFKDPNRAQKFDQEKNRF